MALDLSQNLEAITTFLFPDLMWGDFWKSDDELLKRFKLTYTPYDKIQYDQYANPWGLLTYRGLGADPTQVQMSPLQKYTVDPGYWGEYTTIDESVITQSREPGTLSSPLEIRTLGEYYTLQFHTRIMSAIRKCIADTIGTGQIVYTGPRGTRFTYQIANYASTQIFTPSPSWSSTSGLFVTDMLGYKATLQKGSSNKFGSSSVLLMNSNSIVDIWKQTQIQSTYKAAYGSSLTGLTGTDGGSMANGLNQFLAGKAEQGFDLPTIVLYDEGYYSTLAAALARDKTSWNYIIPTRTALWLSTRPGNQILGEFQLTRHAGLVEQGDAAKYPNADDLMAGEKLEGRDAAAEGLYVRVHYKNRMPHQYEEEVGLNGSPIIGYPGGVAAITWS